MHAVHVTPYGGAWYPDCRTDLELLLDDLFDCSRQRTGAWLFANPLGFVVPHAGLQYSGAVAAAAYRHVRQQQPRRAVILGFTHRGGPAGISIPDIDEYETPLGEVRVDRETMERLASRRPFRFVAEDRICDHSVEIQLPLLQHAARRGAQPRVVPLFVGALDAQERDAAAETLAALCGPDTVFLVSSDLTHYGRAFGYQPFPADSKISARLGQLDRGVMEAVASLDAQFFQEAIEKSRATLCGRAPIALWLRTLAFVRRRRDFPGDAGLPDIRRHHRRLRSHGELWRAGLLSGAVVLGGRRRTEPLLESARETLRHLRATGEHRPIPPRQITPALSRKAGRVRQPAPGRSVCWAAWATG
jgi:MEMO1 family protein